MSFSDDVGKKVNCTFRSCGVANICRVEIFGADSEALRRVFSLVVYLDIASFLRISFFLLIDLPHNFHPTTAMMARKIPATEPPMMDAKGTLAVLDEGDGREPEVEDGEDEKMVVVTTCTEESTADIIQSARKSTI